MIKDWTHKTFDSLSKEFWGDYIEHPLLRRILAIIIDYLVLTPLFFLVAFIFVRDSQSILVLDFPITLIYLTLLNSKHFSGQTIGKRIYKLQTTDERGNEVTLMRSFTRSLPISLLMSGELILLYLNQVNDFSFQIAVVGLVILGFGEVYFTLAKLNRQGLHDIIASTQVTSKATRVQTNKNLDLRLVSGYLILTIAFVSYLIYLWRAN